MLSGRSKTVLFGIAVVLVHLYKLGIPLLCNSKSCKLISGHQDLPILIIADHKM